jgi:hypothetical protein
MVIPGSEVWVYIWQNECYIVAPLTASEFPVVLAFFFSMSGKYYSICCLSFSGNMTDIFCCILDGFMM